MSLEFLTGQMENVSLDMQCRIYVLQEVLGFGVPPPFCQGIPKIDLHIC